MNHTRVYCTVIIAVLLATVGFGAAAQDLPLRAPADLPATHPVAPRLSETPDLTAPDDLAEMRTYTAFSWLDIGAAKYKVTFTDTATNLKTTIKIKAANCNGMTCTFLPRDTAILSKLTDGMVVTWQVMGKVDGSKVFSQTRTVTVNEVVQPTLSGLDNGALLSFHGTVTWSNANAINTSFRVVIIDPANGAKMLNLYLVALACNATCTLAPRHFSQPLTQGKTYKWYVQATGISGETVKSEVRTFVAQ